MFLWENLEISSKALPDEWILPKENVEFLQKLPRFLAEFGFEACLNTIKPQALDLAFKLDCDVFLAMLAESQFEYLYKHEIWQRVFKLVQQIKADNLLNRIQIALEFDHDGKLDNNIPLPAVFICIDEVVMEHELAITKTNKSAYKSDYDLLTNKIINQYLPLLYGKPVNEALAYTITKLATTLPEHAGLVHFGVLLSRPIDAIRVCIVDLTITQILAYLKTQTIKNINKLKEITNVILSELIDHEQLSVLKQLESIIKPRYINLNVLPGFILPYLGIEFHYNNSLATELDATWQAVFNFLSRHQLSTESDLKKVTDWCNTQSFPDERVQSITHVKLAFKLDTKAQAKIYIKANLPQPFKKRFLPLPDTSLARPSYLQGRLLHQGFFEAATQYPNNIAIETEEECFTYAEISSMTYYLSQQIPDSDNKLVAILLPHGWQQAVAVLAILLRGSIYLPLDEHWPAARINEILDHATAKIIITNNHFFNQKIIHASDKQAKLTIVNIDRCDLAANKHNLPAQIKYNQVEDDLAYIIYTSGSTGKPKGVMIKHRSAVNTIADINQRFQMSCQDKFFAFSSLAFDLSVYDLFGSLSLGATLLYLSKPVAVNPSVLAQVVQAKRVTVWNSVPAAIKLLVDYYREETITPIQHNLRIAMLSGDWIPTSLPKHLWEMFGDSLMIVGLGGATEGAIWSILHVISKENCNKASIPYGHCDSMQAQRVIALNEQLELSAVDEKGELYIVGEGVAAGYWRNSEVTQQRFIDLPLWGPAFKTGDLGSCDENGILTFHGRIDFQAKIQGYRVDLAEIEAKIRKIALNILQLPIQELVVVTGKKYLSEEIQLLVHLVMLGELVNHELSIVITKITSLLKNTLPDYAIPKSDGWLLIDKLPLTSNHKIDRTLLAQADFIGQHCKPIDIIHDAKHNEICTTESLNLLWQSILGIEIVMTEASFFELGGDSLSVKRLLSKIKEIYHVTLTISEIYNSQNLFTMAKLIADKQQNNSQIQTIDWQHQFTIEPVIKIQEGHGSILFMLPPASGLSFPYLQMQNDDLQGYTIYALNNPKFGHASPFDSVEAMATHFKDIIKDIQPQGPYTLAGWSFGGVLAVEIARLLRQETEKINFIIMIDSYCPTLEPKQVTEQDYEAVMQALLLAAPATPKNFIPAIKNEYINYHKIILAYQPKTYEGKIYLIKAQPATNSLAMFLTSLSPRVAEQVKERYTDKNYGWRELFKNLVILSIPADHFQLFSTQNSIKALTSLIAKIYREETSITTLSPNQKKQILIEWNQTEADYPKQTIIELFIKQVTNTPDNIAIEFNEQQISYSKLLQQINQVASYLQSQGLQANTLVGIGLERSIELVVTLLAVLKIGGAYLPLDLSHPSARLLYMLEDANTSFLITDSKWQDKFYNYKGKIIAIDKLEVVDLSIATHNRLNNLAYVIYTSGSTGKPKGVMVNQQSVVNLLHNVATKLAITNTDHFLAITSIGFDIAALEIFLPLIKGCKLTIANETCSKDSQALITLITKSQVNVLQATPSTWLMLINAGWQNIGYRKLKLITGGEVLSTNLAQKLLNQNVQFWNFYGPTETTIWATASKIEDNHVITIGRPLANNTLYILNENCQPVPPNVPGEIYIGGEGVALGYLNRPELTQKYFIKNPFITAADAKQGRNLRLYRTGDLGYYQSDGNVVYLKRLDQQVKLRGIRIELGEIENVLRSQANLVDAAVIVHEDQAGQQQLIAYLMTETSASAEENLIDSLQYAIKQQLPAYMMPNQFIFMKEFPRNANGKFDRNALPKPDYTPTHNFVAPQDNLEKELTIIWSEILSINCDKISVTASFFALGGSSLSANSLLNKMKIIKWNITLSDIFRYPTIRQMVELHRKLKRDFLLQEAELTLTISDNAHLTLLPNCPTNILLTGSTGFLGIYLLHQLLQQTEATIYCLVRADKEEQALQRIITSLQQFKLGLTEQQFSRIKIVLGDIAKIKFGLDIKTHDELAKSIDQIYHNAASVNFLGDYGNLCEANVQAVKQIIQLATRDRMKPIHYISTMSVFSVKDLAENKNINEFYLPNYPEYLDNGYAETKWVAERLIYQFKQRFPHLSTTIHRLGLITGDTRYGHYPDSQLLKLVLLNLMTMPVLPEMNREVEVALNPVDNTAHAIVKLALSNNIEQFIFHLNSNKTIKNTHIINILQTEDKIKNIVKYDAWLAQLEQLAKNSSLTHCNALLNYLNIHHSQSQISSFFEEVDDLSNITSAITLEILAKLGVTFAQEPELLLKKYIRKAKEELLILEKESCLLPIRTKGHTPALFLLPPGDGLVFPYLSLSQYLNHQIYGLQSPHFGKETYFASLDEMAAYYLDIIRQCQPSGTYYLGGWSIGGNVALIIANKLLSLGEKVQLVVLFDSVNTQSPVIQIRAQYEQSKKESDFAEAMNIWIKEQHEMHFKIDWRQAMIKERQRSAELLRCYQHAHYSGAVILIKAGSPSIFSWQSPELQAASIELTKDPYNAWQEVLTNIETYSIVANHYELFDKCHIAKIAKILNSQRFSLKSERANQSC